MIEQIDLAGSFTLPGTSMTLNRMGYGAMQLAGRDGDKMVWGPPRDVDGAIAVLREAVASGVNHIDTSDYYGPHVTNQIIKQALHPYPDGLVIVTKLGARRGADGSWIPRLLARRADCGGFTTIFAISVWMCWTWSTCVLAAVMEPSEGSIEEPLTALAELKRQGLIRHIGLSNVQSQAVSEARTITADRVRAEFLQRGAEERRCFDRRSCRARYRLCSIFPARRVHAHCSHRRLTAAAASLEATPMQVALAWLLQRSPNILLIPGTSSVGHLRENLKAATLQIPAQVLADLESIGRGPRQ